MTTRNEQRAREDLARNLRFIEIELFAFCNRKCWFCPNSAIDRLSNEDVMPEATYRNIVSQLGQMSFAGEVTFSRYNEPLSKKELFLDRLRIARSHLPGAKLRTNTNGDYLNREYVHELRDAGLNELFVQQYLGNEESYDHSKMRSAIFRKVDQLGFSYSVVSDLHNQRFEINLNTVGITVHVRGRNFELEGSGRTDALRKMVRESYVQTKACDQPFHNMYIDYNGNAMVCCNTRSDVPEHSGAIMGNVNESELWEIFSCENYASWRLHLADDGIKTGICASCKIGLSVNEFVG